MGEKKEEKKKKKRMTTKQTIEDALEREGES